MKKKKRKENKYNSNKIIKRSLFMLSLYSQTPDHTSFGSTTAIKVLNAAYLCCLYTRKHLITLPFGWSKPVYINILLFRICRCSYVFELRLNVSVGHSTSFLP